MMGGTTMIINRYIRKVTSNTLLACLAAVLIPAYSLAAGGDWEIKLKASTPQKARNNIFLGQKADATDGYDAKYDGDAMLDGVIKAYFPHSEWGRTTTNYWRDIMGPGDEKIWTMKVECDTSGETITVSWVASTLPAGYTAVLTDMSTNSAVDMTARDSYAYANSGPREFKIETAKVQEAPATTTGGTAADSGSGNTTTTTSTGDSVTTTTTTTTGNAGTNDTTPPAVAINSVATPTNSNSQTITGMVEAGAFVSVATDTAASDGTATVTGTTWSYKITGLTKGQNKITVTAADAAGNKTTMTTDIYYDTFGEGSKDGNIDNTGASASRIDGYDLIKMSIGFGSKYGDANWNPVLDLDKTGASDNRIDGNDLMVIGSHFGKAAQ